MTSHTICLESSGFLSIGCFNDCEGLLRHSERELAAPLAEPEWIAALVSALHSNTVDAPRNQSAALLGRLKQVLV